MTDLVTLIKAAIENVPQRDGNGRIDTQAMAEAAAKVAVEEAASLVETSAAMFDHPSVYMGGPSQSAKRQAKYVASVIRDLYRR